MICDTHTHSIYSFDGTETVDAICLEALARKVGVIAITDHAEAMEGVSYNTAEQNRCQNQFYAIDAANEKFGGQLEILHGCELGQPHSNPQYAKSLLERFDFDYVIGSMHFFKGNIDLYDVTYTRENFDNLLKIYFSDTRKMLETGGFQALGHLDYILRRMQRCFDGEPTYRSYENEIRTILKMTAERGMALEVNTSGLRNWMHCIGLERWVLEMFREVGGKYVTIGSDAHKIVNIGEGFSQAVELISSAGFQSYTYYRKKKPILVLIEKGAQIYE